MFRFVLISIIPLCSQKHVPQIIRNEISCVSLIQEGSALVFQPSKVAITKIGNFARNHLIVMVIQVKHL